MTRLPAGRSSTSIPVPAPTPSGSVRRSRPSPPGKSVAATSSKWVLTAAKVSSKRRSTVSASSVRSSSSSFRLASRSARCSASSVSRSFSRSYSSFASGLTWPRVSRRRSRRSSLAASSSRSSPSEGSAPASSEPAPRLAGLGLQARALDVDRRSALAGLGGHAAYVGLLSAQPPQLRGELAGLRGARVHARAERRLEPLDGSREPASVAATAGERRSGSSGSRRLGISSALRSSSSASCASARRRASSWSRTASAVSPENQSSPRSAS